MAHSWLPPLWAPKWGHQPYTTMCTSRFATTVGFHNPATPRTCLQKWYWPGSNRRSQCQNWCMEMAGNSTPGINTSQASASQPHLAEPCTWFYLTRLETPTGHLIQQLQKPILGYQLGCQSSLPHTKKCTSTVGPLELGPTPASTWPGERPGTRYQNMATIKPQPWFLAHSLPNTTHPAITHYSWLTTQWKTPMAFIH